MTEPRRVIGVDPGLAKVGWGVVDAGGPAVELLGYGVVHTAPALPHAERLLAIYRALEEVITKHRPATMAVEEVFQGKNPRSAFLAGEGRGACILAGAVSGLRVVEYPASVVKVSLTGNGRAAKSQVQAMVRRLLCLREDPRPQDASDALAIALTHLQRGRTRLRF